MSRIRLFLIVLISAGAGALASALYFRGLATRGGSAAVSAAASTSTLDRSEAPFASGLAAAPAVVAAKTAPSPEAALAARPKFKRLTWEERDAIMKRFAAEHPGYRAAERAMRLHWLRLQYGDLSKVLGVDRGTADKLLTLLDERNQTRRDVFEVMLEHGVKPRGTEYATVLHEQQGEVDAQIKQLLSPDQYTMLQLAPGIHQSEQILNSALSSDSSGANPPLTSDQTSKLAVEMATTKAYVTWGTKPVAVTGPDAFLTQAQLATLSSASAYLTPDQLASLRNTWATLQAHTYYAHQLTKAFMAAERQ